MPFYNYKFSCSSYLSFYICKYSQPVLVQSGRMLKTLNASPLYLVIFPWKSHSRVGHFNNIFYMYKMFHWICLVKYAPTNCAKQQPFPHVVKKQLAQIETFSRTLPFVYNIVYLFFFFLFFQLWSAIIVNTFGMASLLRTFLQSKSMKDKRSVERLPKSLRPHLRCLSHPSQAPNANVSSECLCFWNSSKIIQLSVVRSNCLSMLTGRPNELTPRLK